jgi:hypothetical protein
MASTYEALLLSLTSQLAPPVTTAPLTSSAVGTPSSGTTETFDAIFGYYQTNLVAGRRYLAVMNGVGLSGTVAGDVYNILIRNSGSSSNPTASSTQVAAAQYVVPTAGGAGQQTFALAGSFLAPTTGANTFGVSVTRKSGTGTGTLLFTREMYVMYLGVV